jgi:hypothetical protein
MLMKLKRLNIKHFLLVSILILVLPVVKEWKTLLMGERVEGVVLEMKRQVSGEGSLFRSVVNRAVIGYYYNERPCIIEGPENLVYDTGKRIPLIVHPDREDKVIIANLAGFYIHHRSIALIVVFFLWIAIYITIVQMQHGTIYGRRD